jgi:hypothetical protein
VCLDVIFSSEITWHLFRGEDIDGLGMYRLSLRYTDRSVVFLVVLLQPIGQFIRVRYSLHFMLPIAPTCKLQ